MKRRKTVPRNTYNSAECHAGVTKAKREALQRQGAAANKPNSDQNGFHVDRGVNFR